MTKRLRTEEEAFQRMLEGEQRAAGSEAESLVKLVQALERSGRPLQGPAPDFQSMLRRRIVAEAERTVAMASLRVRALDWLEEKNRAWRRSFRVVTATGLAAFMMLGSGAMFAAAQTATPADGVRYMFDRAAEGAREAATRGAIPRAYLKMELARERLDEVETMAQRKIAEVDHYERALADMDEDTTQATKLIISAAEDGAGSVPLERLSSFAIVQRERLENLLTDKALPPAAVPAARSSVEVLVRVSDRVGAVIAGCPCPANPLEVDPTGSTSSDGTPTAVGCACEQQSNKQAAGGPRGGGNGGPSDDTKPGPGPGPGTEEPPDPDTLPNVDGTTVDDDLEEIIEDLLDALPTLTPFPLPSPLPTASVSPGPLPLP